VSWFRTAGICESYSLEKFSRELCLLAAAEPRRDRLPVETEYLEQERRRSVIEMIIRAVRRGIATSAIVAALAAAGYAGAYWSEMVDRVEKEVRQKRAVVPADLDSEEMVAPASMQPGGDLEEVAYARYIAGHEGVRTQAYDDGAGNLTIGVGHLLDEGCRPLFAELFGNAVDFDAVVAGERELTPDQAMLLFARDLEEHVARARRLFPDFDSYPAYVREAMLDGVYRGDLSGSPRTIRLINAGRWDEVASEYLNHGEYRRSRKALDDRASYPDGDPRRSSPLPNAGIAPRMEENARRFARYAEELR